MLFIKLFISFLKIFVHLGIHGDEYLAFIEALEKRFGTGADEGTGEEIE